MRTSVFRSAITGSDGEVDAGYLALFWTMVAVLGAIPMMIGVETLALFIGAERRFHVQDLGIGIGSVCTGAGVVIGAVGAFRAGDKPRANTVITSDAHTETKVTNPPPTDHPKPLPEDG